MPDTIFEALAWEREVTDTILEAPLCKVSVTFSLPLGHDRRHHERAERRSALGLGRERGRHIKTKTRERAGQGETNERILQVVQQVNSWQRTNQ